ncbi:MAG: glycosyltransferase family 2 protein [Sarcina sp.]
MQIILRIISIIIFSVGILLLIASTYMALQNLYTIFISFFGYGEVKRDYELIEDKTKFLILVAAHNEEDVIEDTVKNLRKINYDKDLYDIYIVNDNSTDSTGDICKRINIPHINTIEKKFEREGVGKPAGLRYALKALGFERLRDKYDMLMILDADNYVDPNILKELNSQWQQKDKPEAIQTYLDSKNTSSLLSVGYATAYWTTNRFFQLAKYRMGLPNSIGGTGFVVRMDWLFDHNGFCYKSLTEDLEMEIEIVKSGGRILWNHHTKIYDEKPDKLKISIKQRIRWAQGHWYVAFTNCANLVKCFFKELKFKYIDQLIYLFGMGKGIQLLLICVSLFFVLIFALLNLSGAIIFKEINMYVITLFIPLTIFNVVLFIYSYIILTSYALIKEGREDNFAKALIGVLYFGLTYIYTQMIGLLKCRNQNVWVKTPHKHTKKL